MKKGKAITLLTIISVITAFLLVMTFVRFPVGIKNNYNSILGGIQLDYDIGGGYSYTLTLSDDNDKEVEDVNDVLDTIKQRLDTLGYVVYSVKAVKPVDSAVKDYDIRIDARPSINELGELDKSQIDSDIKAVSAYGEVKCFGGESANPSTEILSDVKVVESAYVADTIVNEDGSLSYQVAITLTKEAYDFLMLEIDEHSGSYYLSMKLDNTELLSGSQPLSKDYFMNRTLAITSTSEATAKSFAMQIGSGGLAYKYQFVGASRESTETPYGVLISSPYGENVYTKCLIAILILNVVIMACLIILFRGYGIIASYSMLLFTLLEFVMLIAVPGIKLSLGGVIGIILSTIIAANGFVITARKISEEYSKGKTVKSAIKTAYARSLKPILASGVISGFIGLVALILLSGTIKCFGITLGIGAVLGAIVNLLIGRLFTAIFLPLVSNKERFLNLKREGE